MTIFRPLALLLASLLSHTAIAAPEIPVLEQDYQQRLQQRSDDAQLLIVHYHRQDGNYDGWNLWSWTDGAEGDAYPLDNPTAYGRYATIELAGDAQRQGLIVRKNNWEQRDIQFDRWVDLDDDGVTEVWLVAGNPAVFTRPQDIDLSTRLVSAFLDTSDVITFTATGPLDRRALSAIAVESSGDTAYTAGQPRRSARQASGGVVYELPFQPPVATEDVAKLRIAIQGMGGATVYARDVLDEDRFTAPLITLGPQYTPERTVFRVWSPVSDRVMLQMYRSQRAASPSRFMQMKNVGNGVWEAIVEGDLDGVVYDYTFLSYGKQRTAADINARAASYDSSRSVVVNLDSTDPPGWDDHTHPTLAHPTDEIIYEIHVRDLTIRDPSLAENKRGTYAGLIHRGDVGVYNGGRVTTGLAHLEELGVTAVHLLPIHDFPTSDRDEYNWGYWTTLFNVPEGNYAVDWRDPKSAIRELKEAIMGLHDAGIRVILDVVYNHTSSSFEYSHFDNTVPWYYFRTTVDGRLRNDAGVGNSIADERVMVNKYIRDSLLYWTDEYRIDGYRFDLIGTHQPESVRDWVDALRDVREDLTIYGEPWTGGGPTYFPKGAQRSMRIAVFNDHFRNAIRGDLDGDARGFANGPGGDSGAIKRGVMGAIDDFTDQPEETINYASAHDNLTLWDKILKVTPGVSDDTRRDMQKLSLAAVLTAQGIAFLHGGSDFCRTKQGNHNSYNAGDDINLFDWQRKDEYRDVFDYTRGLIELRKNHPAFRLRTTQDIRRHIDWIDTEDHRLVAWSIDGMGAGDPWDTVIVALNGADQERTVVLPAGTWDVVVDRDTAGTDTLRTAEGNYVLPPYSCVVLKRD
ncbi:MAG: type I pullulanase [Phycisphaerales bacterium]